MNNDELEPVNPRLTRQGVADERAVEIDQTKEGTLSEQGSGKIVRLKNGAQIEAERGWEYLDCLRVLLEDESRHFQTLLAIARGDTDKVDRKSIHFLMHDGLLRRDGSLEAALRDVLLSGYRETEEGPVMANPFQPADAHEARTLEAKEEAERQAFKRKVWSRIRDKEDRGRSP